MSRKSALKDLMNIGDVLDVLKEEFPDVSVSKIRFLESEGLIEPERTPSGYRKFTQADVARLKYILRLQRDHFMPLKVIRKRLAHFDPAELDQAAETVPAEKVERGVPAPSPRTPAATDEEELTISIDGGLSLSWDELVNASGLPEEELGELEEFGLIDSHQLPDGNVFYDEDDLVVAKIAKDFAKYGIEARHLKMYKNFAEKESGLFEQIVVPRAKGGSDGRRQLTQSLTELAKLATRMKRVMLKSSLRNHLHD